MESSTGGRPVTRLGCWLQGPWPYAEGEDPAGPGGRADPGGSPVLDRVAAFAALAEVSGFDSLWVTDQVSSPRGGTPVPTGPEAYSLLGALAARTRRARLGAIPLAIDGRPPSMVAKIVTGIDVISHGRGVLTYGLGPADAVRGARVTEYLRVGRSMLEDESPTFRGNFYTVLDAMNRPGPVQDGGVPVVVFIESPSELAQVAVSEFVGLADAVIVGGGVDEVRQVVDQVRSVVRQRHHNEGSEIAPLQVIGVGPVSEGPGPHDPRPGQAAASAAAWAVESVRDLFGAGVDGCIVPLEMTAPDELLQAIGAGLGAV